MILNVKVHAIRDAQLEEKKQIKKEIKEGIILDPKLAIQQQQLPQEVQQQPTDSGSQNALGAEPKPLDMSSGEMGVELGSAGEI